ALVENTTDEDWQDVRLSLIAGRPISFTMDMYEPLYAQRPVIVPEVYAALRPQTYGQALEAPGEALRESRLQEEGRRAQKREAPGSAAEAPAAPAPRARGMMAEPKPAAPAPPPGPTIMQQALHEGVSAAAQAMELGEFFEYAIKNPVSLARQKSAMLPIVNEAVEGAKVSIYNQRVHAKYPLYGFRLRNATALHLSQGPMTVFDGGVDAVDADRKTVS